MHGTCYIYIVLVFMIAPCYSLYCDTVQSREFVKKITGYSTKIFFFFNSHM